MVQRINFLFSSDSGYGWSETYWYLGSPLSTITPEVTNLLNARAAILGTDCSINYVRMSTGYYRSPLLFDANGTGFGVIDGAGGGTTGPDFVALVMRLQGNPAGIGRIFLRGIPESYYEGDTINLLPPAFDAVQNFGNALLTDFTWGVRTTTVNTPSIRYNAATMAPSSPRGYSFSAPLIPPGLAVGSTITMHQCINVGYNGRKIITNMVGSAPTLITVGGASPQAVEPGTNNPYFTFPPINFNPIMGFNPERISRRAPGRFFGERRGRRSTTLPLRR
jgi:hypothetical protein